MSRMRRLVATCAWAALGYIIWVSLAPVGARPQLVHGLADLDRFLGWFAVTLVFLTAYPRRLGLVLSAIITVIVLVEAAQVLDVTRHGRVHDALVKISASAIAAGIVAIHRSLQRRMQRPAAIDPTPDGSSTSGSRAS